MTVQRNEQPATNFENEATIQPDHPESAYVSQFLVTKMDCPAEERLIRMALDGVEQVAALEFDIPNRKLKVFHNHNLEEVESRIESLDLGAKLESSLNIDHSEMSQALASSSESNLKESAILKTLLAINATMFGVELSVGWWAQSTGLIADSVDMFADAAVYGVALYVVGRSAQMKLRAAHFSGWLQMILALGALSEVLRRLVFGSDPASALMMTFGVVAMIANVACLLLIAKNRDSGAHMKASWIFSANDVIANGGVILAGLLVATTGSRMPDLVIGLIITVVVFLGARRILSLKA